jgi:hypothetical protein
MQMPFRTSGARLLFCIAICGTMMAESDTETKPQLLYRSRGSYLSGSFQGQSAEVRPAPLAADRCHDQAS